MSYEAERLAEQVESKLAWEYPDVEFGVWARLPSEWCCDEHRVRALLGKHEVLVVWLWVLGPSALEVEYLLHRLACSVPITLMDRPTARQLEVRSTVDHFVKQTGRSWVCFD
jgi:hypothetical protein